jgi:hypothetical protein
MLKSPTDETVHLVTEEELLEREMEAEICQRFIRLSCEKMIKARQQRGGIKLHCNLLVVQLLRKARTEIKRLPYECASLLKGASSFGMVSSPPPAHSSKLFLRYRRNAWTEDDQEDEDVDDVSAETLDLDDDFIDDETSEDSAIDMSAFGSVNSMQMEDEEDEEIDVVTCTEEKVVIAGIMPEHPPQLNNTLALEAFDAPPPPPLEPLEYVVEDSDMKGGLIFTVGFRSGEYKRGIEEGTDVAASLTDFQHSLRPTNLSIDPNWAQFIENHSDGEGDFADENDDKPPQSFTCILPPQAQAVEEEDEAERFGAHIGRKRAAIALNLMDIAEKRPCCEVN